MSNRVIPAGSINPNQTIAPGLVVIESLNRGAIAGVPTNIIGAVGTATWGPKNAPVLVTSPSEYVRLFGPVQKTLYDLGTFIEAAYLQGTTGVYYCVRVTDDNDTAASVNLLDTAGAPATGATLTAIYTGTVGNTLQATLTAGTTPSTFKLTIGRPGYVAEIYDNIAGTGAAFWDNLVEAVNNGQSGLRGPSELAVATSGAGTDAPSVSNNPYQFSGGADGNSTITATDLLGADTAGAPTGMYALRQTNVSLFSLVDVSDTSTYSDQDAFAAQTASIAVLVGTPGQSVSDAITAKNGASIADNSAVFLLGDWVYFLDTANNGVVRMISPQGFYAGLMANLSPEQSPLNKQVFGVLNTQKTLQKQRYADAEIVLLMENGIDVISSPSPGGSYFASQTGKSGGLALNINNVFIQRMANFIALSLSRSGVLGKYIGQLQTPDVRRSARNAISAFLNNLVFAGQIEAFDVVLDESNNPQNRVVLGFMEAQVTVQLFSVIIVFLINLETGTSQISN